MPSFCVLEISTSVISCNITRINRSVPRCESSSKAVLTVFNASRKAAKSNSLRIVMRKLAWGSCCNVDCMPVTTCLYDLILDRADWTEELPRISRSISTSPGVSTSGEPLPKLPYLAAAAGWVVVTQRAAVEVVKAVRNSAREVAASEEEEDVTGVSVRYKL